MYRITFVLVFAMLLLFGCAHKVKQLEPIEVSGRFAGVWKQTDKCDVHETMKGNVIIERDEANPKALKVKWINRQFSTFNGVGKYKYIDVYGSAYEVSTDVEVFDQGETLVFASIWKRTQGDSKNISVIMKKYWLNKKDELLYEKYGYNAFEEKGQLILKSYNEWFPKDYHCVMTRESSK